jgi:hypothetical protein
MAVYTTIDNPELYFQTKLYTGNGSDNHAITLDGDEDMAPNLVWLKNRDSGSDSHLFFDTVRGATKYISSNSTAAETTDVDTLDSFTSDGFQVDDKGNVNTNTENYVAWCWKESTTAGFDIVNNVKNDTDVENVSHNLSAVPHWIIGKSTTGGSYRWICYHKDIANTHAQYLNEDFANTDSDTFWNDTDATSSVFTLGADNSWNGTNIFYVWTSIQGFSKFGTYTGNGNADGTFVHTGFRPAFVMIKNESADHSWRLMDNKRTGINPSNSAFDANSVAAEYTNNDIDLLSNGFKIKETDGDTNESGQAMIYMAFAEAPFVNSNGVPNNAR